MQRGVDRRRLEVAGRAVQRGVDRRRLEVAGRAVQRGVDGQRLEGLTQTQIKLFSKLRYTHTKKVD